MGVATVMFLLLQNPAVDIMPDGNGPGVGSDVGVGVAEDDGVGVDVVVGVGVGVGTEPITKAQAAPFNSQLEGNWVESPLAVNPTVTVAPVARFTSYEAPAMTY